MNIMKVYTVYICAWYYAVEIKGRDECKMEWQVDPVRSETFVCLFFSVEKRYFFSSHFKLAEM